MARMDRRERLALDESFRYYRKLSSGVAPELFQLASALSNVSAGLRVSENSQFKLTRQLWRRLQEALFEAYITGFPGSFHLKGAAGVVLESGQSWANAGFVAFRPHGCRRTEDFSEIEIGRLYPRTMEALQLLWAAGNLHCRPEDFEAVPACQDGVCSIGPVVLGLEVLYRESQDNKKVAYQRWWELYWQAYCTVRKDDRATLYRSMMALEAVFGDLYY
jgi:hypothetical protein